MHHSTIPPVLVVHATVAHATILIFFIVNVKGFIKITAAVKAAACFQIEA
jgi:hypothetical protein